MQHTADAFLKPRYADEALDQVVEEWLAALTSRPVSPNTVLNYRKALLSFTKSLGLHDKPLTLESVTESNVLAWKTDMRAGKIQPAASRITNFQRTVGPSSAATIRSYIGVIKVFSNRWLRRRYTEHDLLDYVELGKPVLELKDAFTLAERETLLAAVDGGSFEHVRDRAYVQLLLATACRFKEIYALTTDTVDIESKRLHVTLKGGRQVPVDIDGRALRDFKAYMAARRRVAGSSERAVWLADSGKPLQYWGAYGIFKRLEARTGVTCNPHKFRHTCAQVAAQAGAPVADIQDLLHHTSDHMSRRYIGNARQEVAAGLAVKYSLAG